MFENMDFVISMENDIKFDFYHLNYIWVPFVASRHSLLIPISFLLEYDMNCRVILISFIFLTDLADKMEIMIHDIDDDFHHWTVNMMCCFEFI
jgi:hypothetical protein